MTESDEVSLAKQWVFFVDRRRKKWMKRALLDSSGGFVRILYGGGEKAEMRWRTSEEEKTCSLQTQSSSFSSLSLFTIRKKKKP